MYVVLNVSFFVRHMHSLTSIEIKIHMPRIHPYSKLMKVPLQLDGIVWRTGATVNQAIVR